MSDGFNWNNFNILADSFIDENDEAKQRTGVSRYYFETFCTARDFLNRNKYYLNNKSKKIMTSNKSDVHNETSKIFRKHKKFNNNEIGKIISKELNKLRKMRNQADYNQINNNIDNMIKKSKIRSERILKLLKKLN
nr:hypothetical protein [uncultured Methanobrevibacter sp.]